jgi:hypothetical protein
MQTMKSLIFKISVVFIFFAACDDFVTIAPQSQVSIENSLQTASDFQVAVNGVYAALQLRGTYGVNYVLIQEMRADNSFNGGGPTGLAQAIEAIDKFFELSDNGFIEAVWRDSYIGINRANAVISRIDDASFGQNLKDQLKGEALFLRALINFNLVQAFGNIPIRTQDTRTPTESVEQSTPGQVFNFIIEDLLRAEDLLPASYPPSGVGRATSGAASTLLGKVYLTVGENGLAENVLRDVITSNQYRLLDNYEDLWGENNKNNDESIFEVQYRSGGTGTGSAYTDMYTNTPAGVGDGNTPQSVTDDIWDAFEDGDLRRDATIFFEDDNMFVRKFDGPTFASLDGNVNFVVLRYADVLLMLAEALGEGTEAYGLINQVRARADLDPIDGSTPGTFEQKLLQERRVELAFENHRWHDLKRFGVAIETMSDFLGLPQSNITLLYPIPQREIDISQGVIQQNPEHS